METFDILGEISRSKQYDIALFTTFNYEIGFFEHFILNTLNNNGTKKVSVFADAKQFSAALEEVSDCSIGKRYVVNPISIDGAFHPKLVLLLSENRAKLLVSSANLTLSGYCSNSEVVNVFTFDESSPENLKLISHAIRFFEKLDQMSFGLDRELIRELKKLPYYGKNNTNNDIDLLDNLEASILDQVYQTVPQALSIDVAAPYYDNGLLAVEELRRLYPDAGVTLYVQNEKSRFPVERASDPGFRIHPYSSLLLDEREKPSYRFYHGKVIRFKTADRSFIFYGSANCTSAALCRSFAENGNIECVVLEAGGLGEYDRLFGGFLEESSELNCQRLTCLAPPKENIWFEYGLLEQDCVKLYFGYSGQITIETASLGDTQIDFSAKSGEIEVSVPTDRFAVPSDVFPVCFACGDVTRTVRCWVLIRETLAQYRLSERTEAIYAFDQASTGDKYFKDRYALYQALSLTVEELEREREIRSLFERHPVEVDAENSDDDAEGGIIDYVPPPPESSRQYRLYKELDKIALGYRWSFQTWMKAAWTHGSGKGGAGTAEYERPAVTTIRDEDKSFARFVVYNSRKLLNKDFVALADAESYLTRIQVFFEAFDKYSVFMLPDGQNRTREPLLSPAFVVEMKTRLLTNLMSKEIPAEEEKTVKTLIFLTVLSSHLLGKYRPDAKADDYNRKLLDLLEQDEAFRQTGYIEYVIAAVEMWGQQGITLNHGAEISYVDSLFGYKPFNRVMDSIRADYGKDALVTTEDGRILVVTKTGRLGDYMKIPEGSLYDINNYVRRRGQYHAFSAMIRFDGVPKGPGQAMTITYETSKLPASAIKQTIIRKSGDREVKNMLISQ